MQIIKTLPIGTEVYYFDPVLDGECEIKKSIILGSFVHKSEGSLFYFLLDKQVEGYAVSDTEDGIQILRRAFLNYREKLIEANNENKKRYNIIREGTLFEEYKVDNLPTEDSINELHVGVK